MFCFRSLMSEHESRLIEHALAVLALMAERDGPRVLTPCEKLACRTLAPAIGHGEMKLFCDEFAKAKEPWARGHMKMRVEAIAKKARREATQRI